MPTRKAPKRKDPSILILIMGFLLVLVSVATFGFPQQGPRYDAMKMATVELSTEDGHGSGVIISPNFILTVAHVASVANGHLMDVLFADGTHGMAVELWEDPSRDVAVMVLISATKLAPARLSKLPLKEFEEIWSVGYPLDLPLSIQKGNVASPEVSTVQMDHGADNKAAVYTVITMAPGDSGGPVFNSSGEVVGLNDFITKFGALSGIVAMQAIRDDVQAVTGVN